MAAIKKQKAYRTKKMHTYNCLSLVKCLTFFYTTARRWWRFVWLSHWFQLCCLGWNSLRQCQRNSSTAPAVLITPTITNAALRNQWDPCSLFLLRLISETARVSKPEASTSSIFPPIHQLAHATLPAHAAPSCFWTLQTNGDLHRQDLDWPFLGKCFEKEITLVSKRKKQLQFKNFSRISPRAVIFLSSLEEKPGKLLMVEMYYCVKCDKSS